MQKRSHKVIFFFLLFTFVISLLRTSNLSLLQCSEEEVEMAVKIGDKECDDDFAYAFEDLLSHEIENITFEEKNAAAVNRIIASHYAEPNLENLSYPPELKL
ncbi:MAG: hypothetical protein K0R65_2557 [Crocinitomicaceae bacterium]|jgi:hypothetical protein|nr:hypothetical protein [Crocinitomicaceae bacterium]